MIKFFAYIWLNWLKPIWSKMRWSKYNKIKSDSNGFCSDDINQIRNMSREVYSKFEWVMDNFTQLFDSYRPIPMIYNEYIDATITGKVFKDDCDGYHSCIYHILQNVETLDCAIITLVTKPMSQSHTMCVFTKIENNEKRYYLVDYNNIFGGFNSAQEIVDDYIKRRNIPVRYWNLQKYNYEKSKFYTISKKKY